MAKKADRKAGTSPQSKKAPVVRLFVAVPLWETFRLDAETRFNEIRKYNWPLKWVRPENWHITLKFLGTVPVTAVPSLQAALVERVSGIEPFSLVLGGLGGFPRLSRMRVLWVGIQEGEKPLTALAKSVHLACVSAGYTGDKKPFQAHLTLARSRGEPVSVRVSREIHSGKWGDHRVDSVSLVQSTLTPRGPVYKILSRIPLQSDKG